jgi:hypothetical protein
MIQAILASASPVELLERSRELRPCQPAELLEWSKEIEASR